MKKENIEMVLQFPGFSVYPDKEKDELVKILEDTDLSVAQLDILFNSDSVNGGLIASFVEDSSKVGTAADAAAEWLGKFIWNIEIKKHESYPAEPIIKDVINRLGSYGEKEVEDIQKLITRYVVVHKGKIIQAPLTQDKNPSKLSPMHISHTITLFNTKPKESHEKHDMVSALTLLRLSDIDKLENKKFLETNKMYLPGIIRVLNNLNQLEILSQSNFDKLMQVVPPPDPKQQSLASLALALDRLKDGKLLIKENAQLYFEKLIHDVVHLSGKGFLKLLDRYKREIKSKKILEVSENKSSKGPSGT